MHQDAAIYLVTSARTSESIERKHFHKNQHNMEAVMKGFIWLRMLTKEHIAARSWPHERELHCLTETLFTNKERHCSVWWWLQPLHVHCFT